MDEKGSHLRTKRRKGATEKRERWQNGRVVIISDGAGEFSSEDRQLLDDVLGNAHCLRDWILTDDVGRQLDAKYLHRNETGPS